VNLINLAGAIGLDSGGEREEPEAISSFIFLSGLGNKEGVLQETGEVGEAARKKGKKEKVIFFCLQAKKVGVRGRREEKKELLSHLV